MMVRDMTVGNMERGAPYFLPCGFDVSDMTVCDMMVHDMTAGNMELI